MSPLQLYRHSEPSEESLIIAAAPLGAKTEMFRFAQHDSAQLWDDVIPDVLRAF